MDPMKVIIVDDSQFQRLVVKAIVSNHKSKPEIIELTDAQTALDTISEQKIDLVFTDINMEPFTGIELIEKVNQTDAKPIFAVVTSHLVDSMKDRATELGVKYYVTKPITEEKVNKVLDEVFGD